ncbi:MAG: aminotransferase class V-fold PLP-dependent enzyme [Clostridia bacterium]|nr:aminotransferase class V-fold PLP-dependent enzyme [Clostridia bacterium]
METPIADFVKRYAKSGKERLHMPGHKGISLLGCEKLDITEIYGADSLYEADGIIKESEENASRLFECNTFYSTEGSSQCIRAMLYLAVLHAKKSGKKPLVLAGRNAHKTFLSAAALLDFDIEWLYGDDSYLSCKVSAENVEAAIEKYSPTAVYITSPDYLGNTVDIAEISKVCKKHGVLLLVDNAHGAYLKFLNMSRHPIDLGADIVCDSAHKTLPALTGAAYLHISYGAPEFFAENARKALALFGSTSPSYLTLQSLDLVNKYIADGYSKKLNKFAKEISDLKVLLMYHGFTLVGSEPLKLTIAPKCCGYTGEFLSLILEDHGFVCEFADPDFVVMMLTPESKKLSKLEKVLLSLPFRGNIQEEPPKLHACERVMSVREAMLSDCETVPVEESVGRVLAAATVGCPPAVPIVMCGERIDDAAVQCFEYYGIEKCTVVK